jgi:hypothetical protein
VLGGSTCGREMMNERDDDEGIWLVEFIYEIEQ